MCFEQFFNNASVGSFLGAFFAFFLVFATDSRRNRRKKKMIIKQIKLNRIIIDKKRETVNSHYKNIDEKGILQPGKIMPFQINEIKSLSMEVLNLFKPEEKLALDSICYHMSQTDELLDQVDNLVSEFMRLSVETKKQYSGQNANLKVDRLEEIDIELKNIVASIKTRYKEVLLNIDNIDKTTQLFMSKEYSKILSNINSK